MPRPRVRVVHVSGHYRNGYWVEPHVRHVRGSGRSMTKRGTKTTSATVEPARSSSRLPATERPATTRRTGNRETRSAPSISPGAATVVRQVITDGWTSAVAGQLATALNDRAWRGLSRRRWENAGCRALADLAETIEQSAQLAHSVVGAMADHGLGLLGRPNLERRMAEAFAQKIPLPGQDVIVPVVQALRITGVWVCATAGIDVIASCECLRALAKKETHAALKEVLLHKLNDLGA